MVGGAGVLVARLGLLLVDHLRVLRELEADLTRANFVAVRVRGRVGVAVRARQRSIESRAVLSDTLSPLRQRASPGMASGPKWPWPGMSDMKLLVNGSYLRCGPRKQVAFWSGKGGRASAARRKRLGGCGLRRLGIRL